MYDNSASYLGFPYAEEERIRREEERKWREEERKRREEEKKRREEERKRREEERKRRERESDHNSDERSPKRAKTESGWTPQSLITTNGKGGGSGPSTDQSKINSRLQHLKKGSSLPVIRNLNTELDGEVHPKSKMVEGVVELIKMDLNMEEGIGMAIKVLDNSAKCCKLEDLEEMLIDAVSQAQRAQRAMDRAKEEQNKLRSALVHLLFSGLE